MNKNRLRKLIEEFNEWCKEEDIPIGQDMNLEAIMVADWWIRKFEKLDEKTNQVPLSGTKKEVKNEK